MLAIMKADMQRMFRGKGIYITFGALVAMALALVVSADFIFDMMASEGVAVEGLTASFANGDLTLYMMENVGNIFYFVLPIIVFVVSADFSSGMVKNMLSSGTSRTTYYFAKVILAGVLSMILYVIYMVISVVGIGVLRGFEDVFQVVLLKPFFAQLLIVLASSCIGVFLGFTTKKMSATIGFYVAFFMVASLIATIVTLISETATRWVALDLSMNILTLANVAELSVGDMATYLLVGVGYIAVTVVSGFMIFKKAEIK